MTSVSVVGAPYELADNAIQNVADTKSYGI